MADMRRENGGWYRDRTCDPYHVKDGYIRYLIEKSRRIARDVCASFRIGSLQFWAILGGAKKPEHRNQWMEDCLRWHGRVLTGSFRHYCPDWDFLPIDVSVAEFGTCTCPLPEPLKGHWLHQKSGHSYMVLEQRLVLLEADLTELVLYTRSDGSGPIWARPADEFFDGRFVRME